MTRAEQKHAEKRLLQHALSKLGISYTFIECGERPDFILNVDGRRIGAEVTEYHSDRCRKVVEREWARINDQLDKVRENYSELKCVHVSIELYALRLPRTSQHGQFIRELVDFVRKIRAQISARYQYVRPDSTGQSLLADYIRRIALSKTRSYTHWECGNLEFGGVGSGEEEWLRILDAKLSSKFERDVAEYWLFLIGGHDLSQVMGGLLLERMKNFDRLSSALRRSQYNAVFFCQSKIVRWSRARGWEELIGE